MNTTHFNNTKEVWENSIDYVLDHGQTTQICTDENSIGSLFGKKSRNTIEVLASLTCLKNPRERIFYSDKKKINYSYMLANFLFMFKNNNSLDFIDFYNTKGRMFSDDGKTLNAPTGYRLLNGQNQIHQAGQILKADSSSRRVILQIFDKADLYKKTKDYPCINYFQLFNRDNKLMFITNMRSQSVLNILPYDFFVFTMLQEALSNYFKLELGEYYHYAGSFHIYTDELELATKISNYKDSISFTMKKMTSFNDEVIKELFKAESEIRSLIMNNKQESIDYNKYHLDKYWKSFLKALFDSYLYPENGINNLNSILNIESNCSTLIENENTQLLHL